MRELHWHATAAEWAFVTEGRVRTTVIDPQGCAETNDFEPGDIWYFPRGHGHVIETPGRPAVPLHPGLRQRLLLRVRHLQHHRLDRPRAEGTAGEELRPARVDLRQLSQRRGLFRQGQGSVRRVAAPPLQGWKLPPLTHKYSLLSQKPFETFSGGREWRVDRRAVPDFHDHDRRGAGDGAGALRELHWHPNAAEWQYVLERPIQRDPVRLARPLARRDAAPGRRGLHSAGLRSLHRERRRRDRRASSSSSTAGITSPSICRSGSPAIRRMCWRRTSRRTRPCSTSSRTRMCS